MESSEKQVPFFGNMIVQNDNSSLLDEKMQKVRDIIENI